MSQSREIESIFKKLVLQLHFLKSFKCDNIHKLCILFSDEQYQPSPCQSSVSAHCSLYCGKWENFCKPIQ